METIQVQLRIPKDLLEKIDKTAEEQHRSRANMIKSILLDHWKLTNQQRKGE